MAPAYTQRVQENHVYASTVLKTSVVAAAAAARWLLLLLYFKALVSRWLLRRLPSLFAAAARWLLLHLLLHTLLRSLPAALQLGVSGVRSFAMALLVGR